MNMEIGSSSASLESARCDHSRVVKKSHAQPTTAKPASRYGHCVSSGQRENDVNTHTRCNQWKKACNVDKPKVLYLPVFSIGRNGTALFENVNQRTTLSRSAGASSCKLRAEKYHPWTTVRKEDRIDINRTAEPRG